MIIWISSIKNIKKGEELSYDYGFNFDKSDYRSCMQQRSKYCIGFIISSDDWDKYLKFIKIIKRKSNINKFF